MAEVGGRFPEGTNLHCRASGRMRLKFCPVNTSVRTQRCTFRPVDTIIGHFAYANSGRVVRSPLPRGAETPFRPYGKSPTNKSSTISRAALFFAEICGFSSGSFYGDRAGSGPKSGARVQCVASICAVRSRIWANKCAGMPSSGPSKSASFRKSAPAAPLSAPRRALNAHFRATFRATVDSDFGTLLGDPQSILPGCPQHLTPEILPKPCVRSVRKTRVPMVVVGRWQWTIMCL